MFPQFEDVRGQRIELHELKAMRHGQTLMPEIFRRRPSESTGGLRSLAPWAMCRTRLSGGAHCRFKGSGYRAWGIFIGFFKRWSSISWFRLGCVIRLMMSRCREPLFGAPVVARRSLSPLLFSGGVAWAGSVVESVVQSIGFALFRAIKNHFPVQSF